MSLALLKNFPEWANFLQILPSEEGFFFVINVDAPNKKNKLSLTITTEFNEELTVIFASHHWHFESVENKNVHDGIVHLIHQILNEKLVIVSYLCNNDEIIRDGIFASIAIPSDSLPKENREYFYASSMQIRSWVGTFDSDFLAPYINTPA